MKLNELQIGKTARITGVGGEGALRQHMLDMGVLPGVEVTMMRLAPMGDPMELRIHGYELTLRLEDAEKIEAERIEKPVSPAAPLKLSREALHPGLGEEGKFHPKGTGDPPPEDTVLSFALV